MPLVFFGDKAFDQACEKDFHTFLTCDWKVRMGSQVT